jgi:hypothetical protein
MLQTSYLLSTPITNKPPSIFSANISSASTPPLKTSRIRKLTPSKPPEANLKKKFALVKQSIRRPKVIIESYKFVPMLKSMNKNRIHRQPSPVNNFSIIETDGKKSKNRAIKTRSVSIKLISHLNI